MDQKFTETEIPRAVYITGSTGIVMMFISLIMWCVFYFQFSQVFPPGEDTRKEDRFTPTYTAVLWSGMAFGILGFLLAAGSVIYGNRIKMRNDPKTLFIGNRNILRTPHTQEDHFFNDDEVPNIKKPFPYVGPKNKRLINQEYL